MDAPSSELALLLRIGGRPCALPLEHVVETMRPLPLEPIEGVPAFVRGVALVRGVPLPVVDGARLLGTGTGPGGRWVTIAVGGRKAVLVVDEVLGVRALAADRRMPLPLLLDGAAEGVVAALARLDAQLLLVLQASRVIPEPVWAPPGARAVA